MIIQIIFPTINVEGLKLSPDFFLLLLTIFAVKYERFKCIIIAFLLGFVQDCISHIELIGIFSLSKSITGFLISTIFLKNYLLPKIAKFILIFLVYTIHFSIYYYVVLNDSHASFYKLIFIYSFINIFSLYLVDIIIYKKNIFEK